MNQPPSANFVAFVRRTSRRTVFAAWLAVILLSPATALGQPAELRLPPAASLADVIQSATVDAPPATISVGNRPVAVLRATVTGRAPAVRVAGAEGVIDNLLAGSVPGRVSARPLSGAQVISVGTQDVFALVPADLDLAGTHTLEESAADVVSRLQTAIDEVVEARTPSQMAWATGLAAAATVALVLLLRLLARAHSVLARQTSRAADQQLSRVPGAEVMRATRVTEVLRHAVTAATAGLAILLVYGWLTFVLRRFPYTRPWGEALRGFMIQRFVALGESILAAIPDLFTVALIVLLTRMLTKGASLLFEAVEQGRATIPWVYAETAQPTRRLVTALLWLFALAVAYPYLPGSHTDAFKGVSVFVGLMISLGSSGIVNQMMSGLTLTYSRALRIDDFVRIGDVEGTVTHLGPLSTKLKTPRREEVTIPNAVVVSAQTINYSRLADGEGVFAPTSITIGYDVPWRQVQALLLLAAERTAGVRTTAAPFVLQTGLRDFYVEYTLLIALEHPGMRAPVLNELHGHIQDAFNEHGVQIMSPNYESDPEKPKMVPRERWYESPAATERRG